MGLKKNNHLKDFNSYVDQALKYPEIEPTNYSGFSFLKSGLYSRIISELIENTKKENLFFLDMDLYFDNPNQELRKIQEFIGLPMIYNYPNKLPSVNENPLKFDKSLVLKETNLKLLNFFYDDIEKVKKISNIGLSWV